jgi:hypothetical protein
MQPKSGNSLVAVFLGLMCPAFPSVVSLVFCIAVLSPLASPSLNTLCRSLDAIPDNHKFKQLQRELSQVLTQRQVYIQPDN